MSNTNVTVYVGDRQPSFSDLTGWLEVDDATALVLPVEPTVAAAWCRTLAATLLARAEHYDAEDAQVKADLAAALADVERVRRERAERKGKR